MRILTVRQPHAWALIHGGKDVENRTRNIAGDYRGPVAIHAGLGPFEQDNLASRMHRRMHGSEVPTELVFGAIIGVVDLIDAHRSIGAWSKQNEWTPICCESGWAENTYDGRSVVVHLAVQNPRPLTRPIPARGRLGLWGAANPEAKSYVEEFELLAAIAADLAVSR